MGVDNCLKTASCGVWKVELWHSGRQAGHKSTKSVTFYLVTLLLKGFGQLNYVVVDKIRTYILFSNLTSCIQMC